MINANAILSDKTKFQINYENVLVHVAHALGLKENEYEINYYTGPQFEYGIVNFRSDSLFISIGGWYLNHGLKDKTFSYRGCKRNCYAATHRLPLSDFHNPEKIINAFNEAIKEADY